MAVEVVGKTGNCEAPVEFEADTPTNSPNEPESTSILTAFTSLVLAAIAAKRFSAPVRGRTHVSRQSPNSRRRKGTAQGPLGIQARHRREVRHAILHHQLGRQGGSSISLRGMGTDRAEAGRAFDLQSYEEKVSEQGELLGAGGRDGRTGAAADAATVARCGADQGRSGSERISDVSGSSQPASVPAADGRREVHG